MKNGIYRGIAMTVAGSDSGGGAGIQADLKTFAALRVFGTTAVTSITVQNSLGVSGFYVVPPKVIKEQITAVGRDFNVDAIKTGMIGNKAAVGAVVSGLKSIDARIVVVDPVMIAQSGDPLIEDDAIAAVRELLLPLATLVTPNIPEAERLTGMRIRNAGEMQEAALAMAKLGCAAVLIKGGHLYGGDTVTDVLLSGCEMTVYEDSRIRTDSNHGTGCTLSSAITAEMAAGRCLKDSVLCARRYLRAGMEPGFKAGHGPGCLSHAIRMEWIEDVHA